MCGQVLAPGMRVGWVTAAPALLQRIMYHLQGVSLGANSFTQVCSLPQYQPLLCQCRGKKALFRVGACQVPVFAMRLVVHIRGLFSVDYPR